MKPVVIGIIFRCKEDGSVEILTQRRLVKNKDYDPLYDRTWEAVGETLEKNENVLDALVRGIREECGKPDDFEPEAIYGSKVIDLMNSEDWMSTTDKGDRYLVVEPFDFVQSLGPPQPWIGPVFLVEVRYDFEPDHSKSDGEAGEPKWWSPEQLSQEIESSPKEFMGLHISSLKKFANKVTAGRFP